MAEISDGFIALPGGLGTLEELFEVLTWSQLGFHKKPCGILNINQFYEKLSLFLDHAVDEEFIKPIHREMILVEDEPKVLLAAMENYRAPAVDKWINPKDI